LFGLFITVLLT